MLTLNFNPFPILTTNRLILRKINENDVNEIFILRSDKEIMKYVDRPKAKSKEEALEWIRKIDDFEKRNEAINWAITLKGNDQLLGTICLWNIQKENFRAETGYQLLTEHQGKGIMSEVLSEILDYGFNTMKLHSVEANVNPDNIASIKLLERNHFVREAYFKENYFFEGKFLDSAIYSLLANKKRDSI